MENRLTKENVWYHLLNFSKNSWLGSDYFHLNLVEHIDLKTPQGQKALEKTQRELAKVINLLIDDLKTFNDPKRIISSGDGYKIASTPEEIEAGIKYLFRKIDEPLKRIEWLKKGYREMVHAKSDKTTEDLFV